MLKLFNALSKKREDRLKTKFSAMASRDLNRRLAKAVTSGSYTKAKVALECGAAPNIRYETNKTIFNTEDTEHNWMLFTHAVYRGDMKMAALLAKHGADVNPMEEFGWFNSYKATPLGLLTVRGKTENVKAILEMGADPHRGINEWAPMYGFVSEISPLNYAQRNGLLDVAAILEEHIRQSTTVTTPEPNQPERAVPWCIGGCF